MHPLDFMSRLRVDEGTEVQAGLAANSSRLLRTVVILKKGNAG